MERERVLGKQLLSLAKGSKEASSNDEEWRNPRNRRWSDVVTDSSSRSSSRGESRVELSPKLPSKKGSGASRSPKKEHQTFSRGEVVALLTATQKLASPSEDEDKEGLKTHISRSSKKQRFAHIRAVVDVATEQLAKRRKVACWECGQLDHRSSECSLGKSCRYCHRNGHCIVSFPTRPQKVKESGVSCEGSRGAGRGEEAVAQQEGSRSVLEEASRDTNHRQERRGRNWWGQLCSLPSSAGGGRWAGGSEGASLSSSLSIGKGKEFGQAKGPLSLQPERHPTIFILPPRMSWQCTQICRRPQGWLTRWPEPQEWRTSSKESGPLSTA